MTLLILRREWRAAIVAAVVPALLFALGLLLAVDGADFFTSTIPFLLNAQDDYSQYADASLNGLGTFFGLPGWVVWPFRLLAVGVALTSAWRVTRSWQEDPLARAVDAQHRPAAGQLPRAPGVL